MAGRNIKEGDRTEPAASLTARVNGRAERLSDVNNHVRAARKREVFAVNKELLHLYARIGLDPSDRRDAWEADVSLLVSVDLPAVLPSVVGSTPSNIKYRLDASEAWPAFEDWQQAVGDLPWCHKVLKFTRLTAPDERLASAQAARTYDGTRAVHDKCIDFRTVERQGRALTNFERTLLRYQNRTIEATQVILELIEMSKQLRDAPKRGDTLGLTEDELAFYDALADHSGVREVMGDGVLAAIAHDLVEAIRGSVTIDWTQKEAVRADMRRKVKRLLRKHEYPPDKQEKALVVVIEQAERVCKDWARVA